MARRPPGEQVIDAEFRPDPSYVPPRSLGQDRFQRPVRFAGFAGDGPVTDARQLSQTDQIVLRASMYQTIVALRTAIGLAQARVAATPSTTMAVVGSWLIPTLAPFLFTQAAPADTKAAVGEALGVLSNLTDMRSNEITDVLAGSLAPDRWFASCEVIKNGIAPILQELNDSDTMSLLDSSWDDLKTTMQNLKIPLAIGGSTIGLILLGFAGLVLFQYLTAPLRFLPSKQRSVSGYKGKRRKKKARYVLARVVY